MAQNTVIAIAVDFANVTHAQAFAQIATLVAQAGMAMQVGVGASAPAPATAVAQPTAEVKAPKAPKAKKPPKAPEDTVVRLVVDKTLVKVETLDGKFVGTPSVRKTVNARIREAGGVYDKVVKAYRFTKSAKAKAFAEQETLNTVGVKGEAVVTAECPYVALVTAEQWQAYIDKKAGEDEKA